MNAEVPIPNDPLTSEELSFLAKLTGKDLATIDNAILACAQPRWQKVARMVIKGMEKLSVAYPECTYTILAERIATLAAQGKLEFQGDLSYMRFSEVRLPR